MRERKSGWRGVGRGWALALAVLLAAATGTWTAAQTIQRQTLGGGGEIATGSGFRLESSLGQVASAKLSQSANELYSGYLNTNHAPGTVTDLLALTGAIEGTAQLNWTAPGADGPLGQASALIVKVATSPITTEALFEAASTYAILTPLASGGFETKVLEHLVPGPDYYFALEARDAAKNQGALSNLISTNTFAVPPADITTLALSQVAAGSVRLDWIAPGDDGVVGDLNPGQYRVDFSTDPAHVFNADSYQVLIATMASPGAAQSLLVNGLLGNAAHSFSLFAGDDVPVFSAASNVPQVLTLAYQPFAAAYLNVASTTLTAAWSQTNNRLGTEFFVELSSFPAYSPVLVDSGWTTSTTAPFAGLEPYTTYYARVKARNSAGIETAFTDLGALELTTGLSAPLGILLSSTDRAIQLHWNPVFSGFPEVTRIYRSTDPGGPFTLVAEPAMPSGDYTDQGLDNGTTYFYFLTAASTSKGASQPSPVFFGVPRDNLSPQGLVGIQGLMEGGTFIVQWPANPYNADGSPLADLITYRIYRSTAIDGTSTLLAVQPSSAGASYSDPQGGAAAPSWYFVRAADSSGNESIDSPWVRSSMLREIAWVSPDRRAHLSIPLQVVDVMTQKGVVILWQRHPEEETGRVAASFTVAALDSRTAKPMGGFLLPSPRTVITFRFTPKPSSGQALTANAVFRPDDLSVFLHNGVEYVKIGGQVDTQANIITVQSRSVGRYIVKQSLRSSQFTLLQTAPRRIFTPNADGVNDSFQIFFENPKDSVISQSKVFDITGAEVSDLQLGPTGDSLAWNGRDKSGRVAPGGIYIYQLQAEGRTWNGTVVLAK